METPHVSSLLRWGAIFTAEVAQGFSMGASLDYTRPICYGDEYLWEPQKDTGWKSIQSDGEDEDGDEIWCFGDEEKNEEEKKPPKAPRDEPNFWAREWSWRRLDETEELYLIEERGNSQGPWRYTVFRKVKIIEDPEDPLAPLIEVYNGRWYLSDSIAYGRKYFLEG